MIQTVRHRSRTWQIVDENPHTAWVIEQLPTWETDTFDTIDDYMRGGVFLDVGAWIGLFTLYAAPSAEWVHAFEPDPVACEMLRRNITMNRITNVTVHEKAVWDHDGTVTLRCNEMLGDSMTGPTRSGEGLKVPCVGPDTLRGLASNVDLVKIDTEGSEAVIVPGLLDWPVPMHVSVHEPDVPYAMNYREREVVKLTTGSYHTVLLP